MTAFAICLLAILTEAAFGYPDRLFCRIGHPVTWMGAFLEWLDRRWNRDGDPPGRRQALGASAMIVLVVSTGALAWLLQVLALAALPHVAALLLLGLLASSCLAQRSLDAHVRAVAAALEAGGVDAGRRAVAAIVGRETASLDAAGIARAAIESLAENFADGVVAPAFWLAVLGLPGGMLYKAINTADSMIAHRTPRHADFGFCAAKLDDVASWPGARLAALWLVLAAAIVPGASSSEAFLVMRRDARGHPSPNAGWPEAAMAGALGIRLGGPRTYAGRRVDDAFIGDGPRRADAAAIRAALHLYRIACAIQCVVVLAAALLIGQWS